MRMACVIGDPLHLIIKRKNSGSNTCQNKNVPIFLFSIFNRQVSVTEICTVLNVETSKNRISFQRELYIKKRNRRNPPVMRHIQFILLLLKTKLTINTSYLGSRRIILLSHLMQNSFCSSKPYPKEHLSDRLHRI